jgi:hypothetical protein
MMTEHEQHVQKELHTCVHFNGILNKACRAGVVYHDLFGSGVGCFKHIACLDDPESIKCQLVEFPARDRAEAIVAEDDRIVENFMRALPSVRKHAKEAGLGIGNGGIGQLLCPMECGGIMHYRVAGVNGHLHAKCSTEGCLSWVE